MVVKIELSLDDFSVVQAMLLNELEEWHKSKITLRIAKAFKVDDRVQFKADIIRKWGK